jgi:hypothetical protein
VFLKLICGKGRTRRFPSDNQWVGKGMGSSWSGEDGLGCSWATWMWVTNFPYFQSASKWFEISYLTIKIVKIIQRGEDRCVSQLSVTITNTLANHLRKRKGLFLAHSFGGCSPQLDGHIAFGPDIIQCRMASVHNKTIHPMAQMWKKGSHWGPNFPFKVMPPVIRRPPLCLPLKGSTISP